MNAGEKSTGAASDTVAEFLAGAADLVGNISLTEIHAQLYGEEAASLAARVVRMAHR
jgi:hypothetical protein